MSESNKPLEQKTKKGKDIVFTWHNDSKCWQYQTTDQTIYINNIPNHKYLVAIGDTTSITKLFQPNGIWTVQVFESIWEVLDMIKATTNKTPKFIDPNNNSCSTPKLYY